MKELELKSLEENPNTKTIVMGTTSGSEELGSEELDIDHVKPSSTGDKVGWQLYTYVHVCVWLLY